MRTYSALAFVALAVVILQFSSVEAGKSKFFCRRNVNRLVKSIGKSYAGQDCKIYKIRSKIIWECNEGLCDGLKRKACTHLVKKTLKKDIFPKFCDDKCTPLVCKSNSCRTTVKRWARFPKNCPEKCEAGPGCPNSLTCSPNIPDCPEGQKLKKRSCKCVDDCVPKECKPHSCRETFKKRAPFPHNCPEKCDAGLGCPNELTCSPDIPHCPKGQKINEKTCKCEDECVPIKCDDHSCPLGDKFPANCPQKCSVFGPCPGELKCTADVPHCPDGREVNKDTCECSECKKHRDCPKPTCIDGMSVRYVCVKGTCIEIKKECDCGCDSYRGKCKRHCY